MNYPIGADNDPRAPWHEPETQECPECGEQMEIFDEYPYRKGITIIEWKCPECGFITEDAL